MYTVKQADEYIAANAQNIDKTYYPRYHMAPPIGWMNDPNGLAYFNGEYRLFYQYHPYSDSFGAMHWGQFVSSDLIEYRHGNVALCPSGADEMSCFSGGGHCGGRQAVLDVYSALRNGKRQKRMDMLGGERRR